MNFDPKKKSFVMREAHTRAMLRFLSKADFTTPALLQSFLGLAEASSMTRKIRSWLKSGILENVEVERPFGGKPLRLLKLTPHGQGLALLLGEAPREEISIPKAGLEHSFLSQKILISLWKRGSSAIEREREIDRAKERFGHVPDALATNRKGQRIAIEAERTIKSRSRYRQIAVNWARAILSGQIVGAIYVAPDEATRNGTRNLLQPALKEAFSKSGRALTSDELENAIKFKTITEFEEEARGKRAFEVFQAGEGFYLAWPRAENWAVERLDAREVDLSAVRAALVEQGLGGEPVAMGGEK
jgi:hypothetical protein